MIYKQTILKVVDNTGAKFVKCIKAKSKGKYSSIGHSILVSLYRIKNSLKIKKSILYIGLVVGISKWKIRSNGFIFRFFYNKVVLFSKQHKFIGSRVYGILSKDIKIFLNVSKDKQDLGKVFSYSKFLI